jgi:hypothetical protein
MLSAVSLGVIHTSLSVGIAALSGVFEEADADGAPSLRWQPSAAESRRQAVTAARRRVRNDVLVTTPPQRDKVGIALTG